MTMVFAVKSEPMLDSLKPGDKIRIRAVDDGARFVVTFLEPVK